MDASPPPLHDLAQDPLEVLLRLVVLRERVHRVLDGDGADALEVPADLDAQVGRPGRDLMDEEHPAHLALDRRWTLSRHTRVAYSSCIMAFN
jgi:hypothetical protein